MIRPKVLVTGGTGYIGSHTVVELFEKGYEPVIADNLSNSDISVLNNIESIIGFRPIFYQLDVCDHQKLNEIFNHHTDLVAVIHFAAFKAVGESTIKPLDYYKNNLGSLLVLLEYMRDKGIKDLVFSSSCTVYGQPDQLPVTETTPRKEAESPYGNTKKIGEDIFKFSSTSLKKYLAGTFSAFANKCTVSNSGIVFPFSYKEIEFRDNPISVARAV